MLKHLTGVVRARRLSQVRHPRPARPLFEALEGRLALSWSSIPPSAIAPPTGAVAVTLNSQGDATGSAAITANEIDYYSFTAPVSGSYRISATTPTSNLDTVLGVYSSNGVRVAYNDDISSSN